MCRKATKKTFTLIELLIVVSIIAILVAMLLPVLSKVRATARSVVCLSQLKQVGTGVAMYTQKFNGGFPVGPGAWTSYGWLGKSGSLSRYRSASHGTLASQRPLNEFVVGHKVQDDEELPIAECPGGSANNRYNEKGSHYTSNINTSSEDLQGGGQVKVLKVKSPARMLVSGDAGWWQFEGNHSQIPLDWQFHRMAQGARCNVLFVDGHASKILFVPGIANGDDYTFKRNE